MAHIFKRRYKDKTAKLRTAKEWTVAYDEPVPKGNPRNQRFQGGFRTKKEAEVWFSRRQDELRNGIRGDETRTVAEYLETWSTSINVQPYTRRVYRIHINQHIVPVIGKKRLRNLCPADIEAALFEWATKPRSRRGFASRGDALSPHTRKHIFDTLRAALNKAKKQRIIALNPCDLVDSPTFERQELHAMEPHQAQNLLALFEDEEIGAAIVTALGAGLRRGELLGLRWCDLNFKDGNLTVHRALEWIDSQARFKEPKTKQSRRTIPIPAFLIERLRRHRIEQAKRFDALGLGLPRPETLVFERLGQPIVPNSFGLAFARVIRRSGLPKLRLHDLRHGYATLMLASGVDLKTVSTALGHSTVMTTADIYMHVSPTLMRSAADRLDETIRHKQAITER